MSIEFGAYFECEFWLNGYSFFSFFLLFYFRKIWWEQMNTFICENGICSMPKILIRLDQCFNSSKIWTQFGLHKSGIFWLILCEFHCILIAWAQNFKKCSTFFDSTVFTLQLILPKITLHINIFHFYEGKMKFKISINNETVNKIKNYKSESNVVIIKM